MKKIYSLCFLVAVSGGLFAQSRLSTPTNHSLDWRSPFFTQSSVVANPNDTIWGNFANWTGAQCNGSVGGGYVMGNNGYGDKQKVQSFFSTGPTVIIGSIYWFGAKKVLNGGPTSVVKMRIYKMDGPNGTTSSGTANSPNTVLKNDDVMITAVDTSSMLSGAYIHTFSTQTYWTQDFGVGLAMTSLLAGDTIGGVYSADGDAGNIDQSWDNYSDGTWHTWADPTNWNMNCDMAIFPIVDMSSGIGENTFINGVNLSTYPNPAVDQATISYNLQNDASNVEIKILDAAGKVVSTISEGKQTCGAHTVNIDAKAFAKGTYFVSLKAGNGRIATKLVIQ